jgi:DNA-nicking Smr family endonuclease
MCVPRFLRQKPCFFDAPPRVVAKNLREPGRWPQRLRMLRPGPPAVHHGRTVTQSRNKDAKRRSFKELFGDVKPLGGSSAKRVAPAPEATLARATGRLAAGGSPREPLEVEREGNGIISGRRAKTHQSILDSLEDAFLEVDAECDLHGLTAGEAEREVLRFVESCQRDGGRWVRIIVGKGLHSKGGKGTLRDHVVGALSQRSAARYVLAFRTAPQRLGGTGALTVRLVDRL